MAPTVRSQFILITHDDGLLGPDLELHKDQVWLIEKDDRERSSLYCLSQIDGVRQDARWDKQYVEGRYGAVPLDIGIDLGDVDGEE